MAAPLTSTRINLTFSRTREKVPLSTTTTTTVPYRDGNVFPEYLQALTTRALFGREGAKEKLRNCRIQYLRYGKHRVLYRPIPRPN